MSGGIRDLVVLTALAGAAFAYDRRERLLSAWRDESPADGGNVILVVSDGLRWQEVFRGADSVLLFGGSRMRGADAVRRQYWRTTIAERRAALMPFVWSTIARQGQLLGNRDAGSSVRVTNGLNFSYPGYNELLVGYPDPRIDRNDVGPNPNVTVFEWLHRREDFRRRVAVVGAWRAFEDIFHRGRSRIAMHASRRNPLDARSHAAAMKFLRERRPRALFVAYVETDDHSHDGRYDRTLAAAHAVDRYLAELWSFAQSHPQYRGKTTLIFTADHGRGRTPRDWTNHGRDVAGADEIFVVALGPGLPALGEQRGGASVVQGQVAATVAAAVGLDYRRAVPRAAPPIRDVPRAAAAALQPAR